MNDYFILLFLASALCISCQTTLHGGENEKHFNYSDISERHELANPIDIMPEELLNPANFRVMNDSVMVVTNQPNCEYLLEMYSLNTGKQLGKYASKGQGPEEMLSCYVFCNDNVSPNFYLMDGQMGMIYQENLNDLLSSQSINKTLAYRYSSDIYINGGFCLMGEDGYVASSNWYCPDDRFGNGLQHPLVSYKWGEDHGEETDNYEHVVSPVTGSLVFRNPQNGLIWAADVHRDRINVYNDSLKLVKSIIGPDNMDPRIELLQAGNVNFTYIGFSEGKISYGYIDYFVTKKHIYMVYGGVISDANAGLPPVHILKLDFDGNVLTDYYYPNYLFSISLDKDENYLYAVSRESYEKEIHFYRFDLH